MNKALFVVNVALKSTYDGATTDSLGKYSFISRENGDQLLEASISGYNLVAQKITIGSIPIQQDLAL